MLNLKKLRFLFNCGNILKPIIPFKINILYYSQKSKYKGKSYHNVGDYLSLIVFKRLVKYLGYKNGFKRRTYCISFIGSIIQFLGQNAIIYGSGLLYDNNNIRSILAKKRLNFDIRAVRGPETRRVLIELGYNVPQVYGDPAILLPILYKPTKIEKKYNYILIPHKSKINKYEEQGYKVLSTITEDWKYFINEILSSKLVISSSLHGIIIAEAYGIPAVLLNDTEHHDIFKFRDYYYSTGRYNIIMVNSIQEALNLGSIKLPDLKKLQEGLINAFPKDIFHA